MKSKTHLTRISDELFSWFLTPDASIKILDYSIEEIKKEILGIKKNMKGCESLLTINKVLKFITHDKNSFSFSGVYTEQNQTYVTIHVDLSKCINDGICNENVRYYTYRENSENILKLIGIINDTKLNTSVDNIYFKDKGCTVVNLNYNIDSCYQKLRTLEQKKVQINHLVNGKYNHLDLNTFLEHYSKKEVLLYDDLLLLTDDLKHKNYLVCSSDYDKYISIIRMLVNQKKW